MKYILLALFFVTTECMAVFSENECTKKEDIDKFSMLYKVEIKHYEAEGIETNQDWLITIPTKYKKYEFDSLYFVLIQNGKEVLRTHLDTEKENENIISFISIHNNIEKNVKLYAIYNEYPGMTIFDMPFCRFELDKKHNKSTQATSDAAIGFKLDTRL